ncbi:hypothetical protein ACQR16_07330 [Bradyrhizobium oligotrophicum]
MAGGVTPPARLPSTCGTAIAAQQLRPGVLTMYSLSSAACSRPVRIARA